MGASIIRGAVVGLGLMTRRAIQARRSNPRPLKEELGHDEKLDKEQEGQKTDGDYEAVEGSVLPTGAAEDRRTRASPEGVLEGGVLAQRDAEEVLTW